MMCPSLGLAPNTSHMVLHSYSLTFLFGHLNIDDPAKESEED